MNTFYNTEELYTLFIDCDQKITTDTRKLESGAIFFALKGDNFDANSFALTAITQGCAYAVVDNISIEKNDKIILVDNVLEALQNLAKYHRKQLTYPIIGITGSNAKTTHKELIHAVLSTQYNVYATKGNLNNHIGVPLTLLALTKKHTMAIVEMGANHQGEIELLSSIADPDYGIITNIGRAHLEGFGGIEGIKKGKSELYKHIKQKHGKIFINADDNVLQELSEGIDKITYGTSNKNDVFGELITTDEFVHFKWAKNNESITLKNTVNTHLYGHYNFINVLCAACIGNYFNVTEQNINDALSSYIPEMNRSQVKKTTTNTLILDAYNANPNSMALAIDHFVNQNFTPSLIVLGDMLELGEYTKEEHLAILKKIHSYQSSQVVLIGPYFFEFKSQFTSYLFFKTTDEAITYFKDNSVLKTTVLIKGSRGLKLEKLVELF